MKKNLCEETEKIKLINLLHFLLIYECEKWTKKKKKKNNNNNNKKNKSES